MAHNAVWKGWKRIVAIVNVKELLASWCKDSSDKRVSWLHACQPSYALCAIDCCIQVSDWLKNKMPLRRRKGVKSYVTMRARVLAASADSILEELKDEFGIEHQLSKTFILERICQMTRADSEEVQNQLLRWIFNDSGSSTLSTDLTIAAVVECKIPAHEKLRSLQFVRE